MSTEQILSLLVAERDRIDGIDRLPYLPREKLPKLQLYSESDGEQPKQPKALLELYLTSN